MVVCYICEFIKAVSNCDTSTGHFSFEFGAFLTPLPSNMRRKAGDFRLIITQVILLLQQNPVKPSR